MDETIRLRPLAPGEAKVGMIVYGWCRELTLGTESNPLVRPACVVAAMIAVVSSTGKSVRVARWDDRAFRWAGPEATYCLLRRHVWRVAENAEPDDAALTPPAVV